MFFEFLSINLWAIPSKVLHPAANVLKGIIILVYGQDFRICNQVNGKYLNGD